MAKRGRPPKTPTKKPQARFVDGYEVPETGTALKHNTPSNKRIKHAHKFNPGEITFLEHYATSLDFNLAQEKCGMSKGDICKNRFIQTEMKKIEGLIRQGYLLKAKLAGANHVRLMEKFEGLHDEIIDHAKQAMDSQDETKSKNATSNIKTAAQYAGTVARMSGDAMKASGEFEQSHDITGPMVTININIDGDDHQNAKTIDSTTIDIGDDK